MIRKTSLPQLALNEGQALQDILNIVKLPSGFSRLTSVQRRKLVAAMLATVIPCDGRVREVEIKHFVDHLQHQYRFTKDEQMIALSFLRNRLTLKQLNIAAKQLQELLSADEEQTRAASANGIAA